MQITAATDLAQFVGIPTDVVYQLTERQRVTTHHVTVVIDEIHHGEGTRPGYGLEEGVHGRAVYRTVNGQPACGSSWFFWPYDGLSVVPAT